jgi:hypothetical protein
MAASKVAKEKKLYMVVSEPRQGYREAFTMAIIIVRAGSSAEALRVAQAKYPQVFERDTRYFLKLKAKLVKGDVNYL